MTKKVLALLLVVCMVVGMIPTFASAAEPATVAVSGKTGRTYYTEKRMAAMQNNIEQYQWAQDMRDTAVKNADSYLKKADNLGVDLAEYAYSHLLPSQEIPRGILVGLRWDPMGYHCKFCDKDLRLIRSRDKLYDTNPFGIDPDPNDEEIIVEPWKIQCPNCRRCFPSNDFKSFYESGLDEHGNFSYEKALQDGQEFLVNEDFPEKDEYVDGNGIIHNEGVHNWGVDDSRGYRTGKTYSPGDVSLYKTRYGVDFSVMEETWTFIAYYAHYGLWRGDVNRILTHFRDAYLYTGDAKYGRVGAIMIDRIADLYPEMFTKTWYEYSNSDGNTPTGKMVGSIWQTGSSTLYAQAYDAFYPMYDDQAVVSFIADKAEKYHLDKDYYVPDYDSWDYDVDGFKNANYTEPTVLKKGNSKNTSALIRQNIEENLIAENIRAVYQANISGNFGMHQNTMATSAVVLDTNPMTKEALDWLTTPAESGYGDEKRFVSALTGTANKTDDDVDGGNVINALTEQVYNDGATIEGAPNYARFWPEQIYSMIYALADYDGYNGVDFLKNPKVLMMFKQMNPLLLLRKKTLSVGDSSDYYGEFMFPENKAIFMLTNDVETGQLLYWMNGNTVEGLHGDIFDDSAKMQEQVQKIIDTHGEYDFDQSEQATGWGLSIVRNGTKVGLVDSQRFNYIYSGVSSHHGHQNKMELGLGAFGIDFAPDFGYPEAADGTYRVVYRDKATITSNTVIVDDVIQPQVRSRGFPLHFDDSERVSVIDMRDTTAYDNVDEYRRSTVMVEVDEMNAYTVDFFRVIGGDSHVYNFHAASSGDATGNLNFVEQTTGTYAGPNVPVEGYRGTSNTSGYDFLTNVRRAASPGESFTVDFPINVFDGYKAGDDYHLKMTMLNDFDLTEVALAKCDTPRITGNPTDPIEFVLARREGTNLDSLFTTVFEPYDTTSFIASQESVPITRVGGSAEGAKDTAKAIKVTLKNGRVDYIVYASNGGVRYKVDNLFEFKGFVGVYMLKDASATEPMYLYLNDGTRLGSMAGEAAYTGAIVDFTTGDTLDNSITVTINEECNPYDLIGEYVYIANDGEENAVYEIESVEILDDGNVKLKTGLISYIRGMADSQDVSKGYTYNIAKGQAFKIPCTAVMDDSPVFDAPAASTVKLGESITMTLEATDPLGGTVSFDTLKNTPGVSISGNTLTFTPKREQLGKNVIGLVAENAGSQTVVYWETTVVLPEADYAYQFKKYCDMLKAGNMSDEDIKSKLQNVTASDTNGYGGWKVGPYTAKPAYNGDVYISGKDAYYAVTVEIAESGEYITQLLYDAWATTGEGSVHIAPSDVNPAEAITDAYKVIDMPEYRDYVDDLEIIAPENIMLGKGTYNIYFVHRGSYWAILNQETGKWDGYYIDSDTGETVSGGNDRYTVFHALNLYKVGEYSFPASSVSISGESHILGVGKTMTLSADVLPKEAALQPIVWSSSNTDVATVADGVVTGVTSGIATITASVGGKSATYDIIVGEQKYNYQMKKYAGDKNSASVLNTATEASTANYGKWAYYKHADKSNISYHKDSGRVYFQGDDGNAWWAIKVNITEPGIYYARMSYDGWSSHADGKVCIAPASVDDATAREHYSVISVPQTRADEFGFFADAEAPIFLDKGEYHIFFERTSTYLNDYKNRYMTIDALELYKVRDVEVTITGAEDGKFLTVGDTCELSATVVPAIANQTVTWSVRGDAVSFENGVVTALKAGTATVTATAAGKSDSVTFTVGEMKQPALRFEDWADANNGLDFSKSTADYGNWTYNSSNSTGSAGYNGQVFFEQSDGGVKPRALAFDVEITTPGVYRARMTYDNWGSSAGGTVFIAPSAVAAADAKTDAYEAVSFPWSSVVAKNDCVADGTKDLYLEAGTYTVYFQNNGTYKYPENTWYDWDNRVLVNNNTKNDRYLVIDKLELFWVSDVAVTGIELTVDTDFVGTDKPVTVTPVLDPESAGYREADIVWTSSDDSIATVNGGVVTGHKAGNVTITATIDGHSDSIDLFVAEHKHTYDLQGYAQKLSADGLSNADVANKFNYKALSDGTAAAKITATDTEGYGNWAFENRSYGFSYNGDLYASGYGGFWTISFTIEEAGLYRAEMIYDQWGNSADGAVFIAKEAADSQSGDEQFRVVSIPMATADTPDDVSVLGDKVFLLEEGTYYATFVPYGTNYYVTDRANKRHYFYAPEGSPRPSELPTIDANDNITVPDGWLEGNHDWYFVIDELKLYKVGGMISTTEGASMRYKNPIGLRFISSIDKDLLDDVTEFGTVLVPTKALTGATTYTNNDIKIGANLNGYSVAKCPNTASKYYMVYANRVEYTAVLIKIKPDNYDRDITVRSYAILKDGTVIYGNCSKPRSILTVAQMILDDETAPNSWKTAAQLVIDGKELPVE